MALTGAGGWLGEESRRLAGGAYPSFVYGSVSRSDSGTYLPVFAFHTLHREDFRARLAFLARNGYSTLTLDEALDHLTGANAAPDRSVVLTIDDGRLSTWSVGLPLLEQFGMIATAFVVPGYLGSGSVRPQLDDPNRDRVDDEIRERDDRRTFLRWSEVKALHGSGVVQIESHSMLHKRVVTSDRLLGFLTPDFSGPPFDLSLPVDRQSGWTPEEIERRLGAPIFEHEAVLGTRWASPPPERLVEACVQLVRDAGGRRFFQRSGWRTRLRRVVDEHAVGGFPKVRTEDAQRYELEASKQALEERLGGKRVRHLCLPSGAGSEAATSLAREAGYATVSWGLLEGDRSANRVGSDPRHLERIKHDYVFRLPGRGRRGLARVLLAKAVRRLSGRTGY